MEQVELALRILALSRSIQEIRDKFAAGIGGWGESVTLQKLKTQRASLMAKRKLELVHVHPEPETLPPFYKRTPEEVRELIAAGM